MSFHYFVEKGAKPLKLPFNILKHIHKSGKICFDAHNHSVLEILAVIQGELFIETDNVKFSLTSGEVCVINSYETHKGLSGQYAGDTAYLCLTLDLEQLLPLSKSMFAESLPWLISGKATFENLCNQDTKAEIFELLKKLELIEENSPYNDCKKLSYVYEVLAILFKENYRVDDEKEKSFIRNKEFMRKVSEFVEENYMNEKLSSSLIAKEFFISCDYFCHLFRHHYGTTFISYLCRYRVNKAIVLYRGSNLPMGDIARMVGFSDYSYFSRSFKKIIGLSPARYFGKWQKIKKNQNEC